VTSPVPRAVPPTDLTALSMQHNARRVMDAHPGRLLGAREVPGTSCDGPVTKHETAHGPSAVGGSAHSPGAHHRLTVTPAPAVRNRTLGHREDLAVASGFDAQICMRFVVWRQAGFLILFIKIENYGLAQSQAAPPPRRHWLPDGTPSRPESWAGGTRCWNMG
jgi:hypothetical protein